MKVLALVLLFPLARGCKPATDQTCPPAIHDYQKCGRLPPKALRCLDLIGVKPGQPLPPGVTQAQALGCIIQDLDHSETENEQLRRQFLACSE